MKTRLFYSFVIMAGLIFLVACQQNSSQNNDAFYRSLSDNIQETCINDPENSMAYIDSLENNAIVTPEIADYFRANTHYALNNLRAVEYYNKRALNGEALFNDWRRAYYVASRNLANNLNWKGDYDGSLEYATKAYEKTIDDTTFVAKLNAPGLLLQIALCQKSLGNDTESYKNFEQGYRLDCQLVKNDTSFNTHYYFFQNTLAVISRMDSLTSRDVAELWIQRSEDAAAQLFESGRLHPLGLLDQNLMKTAQAQLYISKARIQIQMGLTKEADKNYQEFLNTDYAKGLGGIIGQYNYMVMAKQWDRAAALIPLVDSVRAIRGDYYSMDYLLRLNQQRLTLERAGLHQQAQQKAELLMNRLDTVVKVQQRSVAQELAVVFETAQKERKIAEQETKIERQWSFVVGVPLVIAIIFFVFYTMHRQKEIKKMAQGHRKLQKAYDQLIVANEKAEESSKMKMAFIQQISHEIRTPLNVLSGFVQVITDESYELGEQGRKDAAKHILTNTNRITEVVGKMLELSEATSHAAIQRNNMVTVRALATKAIDSVQEEKSPDINFTTQIDDNVAMVELKTHEQHAARALTFILNNAWKFTKKGSILLAADLSDDKKFVRFIVEDTGIGIPAKESEHIFEEFVQLDEYSKGTGIGLTVARSFARNLGGDIILDITYHHGARFIMTLPLN